MHTGINREIILLAMNYTHALKLSRAYAPLNAPFEWGLVTRHLQQFYSLNLSTILMLR